MKLSDRLLAMANRRGIRMLALDLRADALRLEQRVEDLSARVEELTRDLARAQNAHSAVCRALVIDAMER